MTSLPMSSEHTRTLPTTNYLIVDLETFTLRARFDPSYEVYFGGVLTVDGEGKPTYTTYYSTEELVAYVDAKVDDGFVLVCHNARFDWSCLRTRGLRAPITSVYCTQTLSYLLDNTRESYSLSALTGAKENLIEALVEEGYLSEPVKLADFWAQYHGDNTRLLKRLEGYCKQDVRATHALYKTLADKLPVEVLAYYHEVEQKKLAVLCDLEQTGIAVDQPLLQELLSTLTQQQQALHAQINANIGLLPKLSYNEEKETFVPVEKTYASGSYTNKTHVPPYYTDNNGVFVRSWVGHIDNGEPLRLYNHCELLPFNSAAATGHTYWIIARDCPSALEFAGKTKSGKPQVNKDFINDISDLLPQEFPVGKLAKVTKRLQMARTIAENVGEDGRIHCDFAHTRTLTGRLATSNPNLQNIPRAGESEDSQVFRKLFVASPGNVLLCADFAAIELRVLAYFLAKVEGDLSMANVFMSDNPDAHTANAAKWGVSRTVAKTLIFLLIYGGQPKLMFARKLFPTIEEAEAAFEGVHKSQPTIRLLMQKVIKSATKKGYVRSLMGRHMHYPGLNNRNKWERLRAERQCFNALIQGSSADILHKLMGESAPAVAEANAHFVNVVHDEVIVEVAKENSKRLLDNLNDLWNYRMDLLGLLPITGDWNSGATWYEAK